MSNVNKVDYDVLETAVTTYATQAEAIDEALTALINMNAELEAGWTNKTATAYLNRFEEEYKIALQEVRDAVQGLSDYIKSYKENIGIGDETSAANIGA